ncbi:MAG: ribosome biogenesis/translation initiation ATPase RLI [Nitrososphaerales archaeon]
MSFTRLAIIDKDLCKPQKCRQECRKGCPVVQMGKLCIEVKPSDSIAKISEELCIGCGSCVKKCPFGAIKIVNLPAGYDQHTVHRYGANGFRLHRLPQPRPGEITGIVGGNGTGKSTILKILAGKLVPNFGQGQEDWDFTIKHFRGSELQNYFTRLIKEGHSAVIKPQYVEFVPRTVKGKVKDHLQDSTLIEQCELSHLLEREIKFLSGGEVQRFCLAVALSKKAKVTLLDEVSNFLDAGMRLKMARVIQSYVDPDRYILLVEHDLALLDMLANTIFLLVGEPAAYGIVSAPFNIRDGLNIFLNGYLPTDNLKFRDQPITFHRPQETDAEDEHAEGQEIPYPEFQTQKGDFQLEVSAGSYRPSEVILILGNNGLGKSLTLDHLRLTIPKVSYKPQLIDPQFKGTVRQLLYSKIASSMVDVNFQREVSRPLRIDELLDHEVEVLSGGEIQRVALTLALGKSADLYLIDEPSAGLDVEMRMTAAKVIRRFIMNHRRTAFVVEHDFTMGLMLASRVVVFDGTPGKSGKAGSPEPLETGMNRFLRQLNVTYRLDPESNRHRINKPGSVKDTEQKISGQYFLESQQRQ